MSFVHGSEVEAVHSPETFSARTDGRRKVCGPPTSSSSPSGPDEGYAHAPDLLREAAEVMRIGTELTARGAAIVGSLERDRRGRACL
ncbi:hypothetical protein ABZ070_31145 [Streptomyces sp. NPDC006283]|uniref:hypothetical protein n=1 Tax=Streptomyces sp. NPDC006283 TaxID=3156741 RepID=UPI0033AF7EA4